jgi:hypothetical protein
MVWPLESTLVVGPRIARWLKCSSFEIEYEESDFGSLCASYGSIITGDVFNYSLMKARASGLESGYKSKAARRRPSAAQAWSFAFQLIRVVITSCGT